MSIQQAQAIRDLEARVDVLERAVIQLQQQRIEANHQAIQAAIERSRAQDAPRPRGRPRKALNG